MGYLQFGFSKGKSNRVGTFDDGSCGHDDYDTAQAPDNTILRGESARPLAGVYVNERKTFLDRFWARGCLVASVGREEELVRNRIPNQEQEEERRICSRYEGKRRRIDGTNSRACDSDPLYPL